MIVGAEVVIRHSSFFAWNGTCGRIRFFFTTHTGARAAVIRLNAIALEVVFPVDELELADQQEVTA